jgi:hypothetical protein
MSVSAENHIESQHRRQCAHDGRMIAIGDALEAAGTATIYNSEHGQLPLGETAQHGHPFLGVVIPAHSGRLGVVERIAPMSDPLATAFAEFLLVCFVGLNDA